MLGRTVDRVVLFQPAGQQTFISIDLLVPVAHVRLDVGDHRDNDLLPAHKAGFRTALIRRGPWGYLWADDPVVTSTATWVVNSLAELPDLLRPQD